MSGLCSFEKMRKLTLTVLCVDGRIDLLYDKLRASSVANIA